MVTTNKKEDGEKIILTIDLPSIHVPDIQNAIYRMLCSIDETKKLNSFFDDLYFIMQLLEAFSLQEHQVKAALKVPLEKENEQE